MQWYTEEFMTTEEAIKLMSKAPKGDYAGDLEDLYMTVCKKSEFDKYAILPKLNSKGLERYKAFVNAIDPVKYGLSALTKGKLSYTGTNDLDSYIVM